MSGYFNSDEFSGKMVCLYFTVALWSNDAQTIRSVWNSFGCVADNWHIKGDRAVLVVSMQNDLSYEKISSTRCYILHKFETPLRLPTAPPTSFHHQFRFTSSHISAFYHSTDNHLIPKLHLAQDPSWPSGAQSFTLSCHSLCYLQLSTQRVQSRPFSLSTADQQI